jgi:uncharacterized protein YdaU (DUF1376 family)/ribosomal protein L37E
MSKKPSFALHSYPWYVADWRESETRIEMTLEERGAFREAIDYCYREGSLPNDRRKLLAILACTEEEFTRAWPAVEAQFIKTEDGRLENHRVNEVLPELERWHEQRRKAGRVSGLKRRKNTRKRAEQPLNGRPTVTEPEHEPSTSSSTPTPTSASASAPPPPVADASVVVPVVELSGSLQEPGPTTTTTSWWTQADFEAAWEILDGARGPQMPPVKADVVTNVLKNVQSLDDLRLYVANSDFSHAKGWGWVITDLADHWSGRRADAIAHDERVKKKPQAPPLCERCGSTGFHDDETDSYKIQACRECGYAAARLAKDPTYLERKNSERARQMAGAA